ncbi:class I SAM-dependent methyltransferase [Nocardia uniformis]|uniref:Class I SAM-dependent methyltransferase n=1 Tax=Nocardia uniformis TaxID=53432 RepID=A0A849C9K9_9NOCA|nr:class I SAM-dependent methyltransferase [Nocardia uniformis]NNH74526.1 class I SAM-dependent methyltransferase [Nocardia uniformis]
MTEVANVVRTAYDKVAELYAAMYERALGQMPFDRAMLGAFAELAADTGPVADLGCGPGRLTGHLHAVGLDVFGVDLSPEMIRLARIAHPEIRFEQGSMASLDLADGALGALVAWYSIIHTPPEQLPTILDEFARVLRPNGLALLAFPVTDASVEAFDHKVATAYRWSPESLAELLDRHGLRTTMRMVREPNELERGRQACLLVEKGA